MNERERVIQICSDIGLRSDLYVVDGSGSLILHGITTAERGKPMGDLDVFVATGVWFEILWEQGALWDLNLPDWDDNEKRCDPPVLSRMMYDLRVDMYYDYRHRNIGNKNVPFFILNSRLIDGIPCVPLQFIYDWKCEVGRAKDQIDIEILKKRPEVNYQGVM